MKRNRRTIDGSYSYSGVGAGPHAVTSIASCAGCNVNGQTNPTFSYDADGNMTSDAGRSLTYTSFDMASSVAQGNNGTAIAYDPEHNRVSLTNSISGAATWYLNNPAAGVATEYVPGNTPVWRDYLRAYGYIVAERFLTGSTASMSYFVVDHLDSTTVLSNSSQSEQEYDSADAWGKRRNANGTGWEGCFVDRPPSITLRGYTGQEVMNSYCLVNLNARLYDPAIGRMLSADSVVPDSFNGQTYNRYSYVANSPLTRTDPTGHCWCFYDVTNGLIFRVDGSNPPADTGDAGEMLGSGDGEVNAAGGMFYTGTAPFDPNSDDDLSENAYDLDPSQDTSATNDPPAVDLSGAMYAAATGIAALGGLLADGLLDLAGEAATTEFAGQDATTSVFWSGSNSNLSSQTIAEGWAVANDGQTLSMSSFAVAPEASDEVVQAASTAFANNASGVVQVFQPAAGIPVDSIWAGYEYPTLIGNENVTGFSYQMFDGSGNIIENIYVPNN